MTVSTTTSIISYTGNGVTTAFAFTSPAYAATDIRVIVRVDATGIETVQALTTNYTLGTAPYPSGGTVTMLVAPASGETLIIKVLLPQTQTLDLAENDIMPAESLEDALDRAVMLIQQIQEELGRAYRQQEGDTASVVLPNSVDRASKFLQWDASGNPTAVSVLTEGSLAVSAYIETLLNDANAATARATLDAAALTVANTFTGANIFTKIQSWAKGADIVSAATLVLGGDGNYFDVTGTTGPITAITVPAGAVFMLQFDSAPVLTHHATNLNLPGGVNLTAEAGDTLLGFATAANQVKVLGYQRASGLPLHTFESSAQTITSGGALTLAHGLGKQPTRYQAYAKCLTTEGAYSVGDETPLDSHPIGSAGTANSAGVSLVPDATNINLRYGSQTSAIERMLRKDTGANFSPTNANWQVVVRARL